MSSLYLSYWETLDILTSHKDCLRSEGDMSSFWPKVIWVSSRSLEEKNTKSVFGSYVNIFIKHWNLLNHTKAAFVQRAWYDFTEGFILRASSRFLEKQVQNSSLLNQDILKVPTAHKDCICLEGIYWFKTKVFWVSSGSLEKSANCVPDQYLTYGEVLEVYTSQKDCL